MARDGAICGIETFATICITMYGILLFDTSAVGGIVLVWMAAVVQMGWTVVRMADVLYGT